jgi:hypothetical protein
MTFEIFFPDAVPENIAESDMLQISPNPADRECVVSWILNDGVSATLQISDMKGRKVFTWGVSDDNSKTVKTALLAPGEYVVALITNDKVIRKRLVVAR